MYGRNGILGSIASTSSSQCIYRVRLCIIVGIGGTSAMGVILFEISPVLTILQRLVPRVLAGLLTVGVRFTSSLLTICGLGSII